MAISGMVLISGKRIENGRWFWKGQAGNSGGVRGSTFYRNRQKAMEPLWETLEMMGIKPKQECIQPIDSLTKAVGDAADDGSERVKL